MRILVIPPLTNILDNVLKNSTAHFEVVYSWMDIS